MATVKVGLEMLLTDVKAQQLLAGQVAYLCHPASVTSNLSFGATHLKNLLGRRLIALFGAQHGFQCDVQDNMVETPSLARHRWFDLPIHSLYGEVRHPTPDMLQGVDTLVVDLQDAGTRVYTYLSTLVACMESCAKEGIRVVVLDRPNPAGGEMVEGNILESRWRSFVGPLTIPMRHAMTLGELARFAQKSEGIDVDCHIVPLQGWRRRHFWQDTGLVWINPSPNLPTPESAITFCGTVLFEGCNASEGRGTTRPLEIIGAPGIEAWSWGEELNAEFDDWEFDGAILRPVSFIPTFQKHAGVSCAGVQIHVTKAKNLRSWRLGQWLLSRLRRKLGESFAWNDKPYEYESERLAIDLINASEKPRLWCEGPATLDELVALEQPGRQAFLDLREECLLYA